MIDRSSKAGALPGASAARGLWERLVAPSPVLADVADRVHARFLAGLLLVIVTAGFLSGLVQQALVPGFLPTFLVMNGALAVLAAAYLASRTRWYRWGGAVAALAPLVACLAVAARNPDDRVWYAFMGLGVLLAAMFLSVRATAIVAGLAVAGILAVAAAVPELRDPHRLLPPLMFHLVFSPLMLLAAAHRNRLEEERRRALLATQAAIAESERLDAVSRLATGVAHDFNNLLTVIFAGIESLEAGAAPQREALLDVRAAAERSAALVRQLLSFSRRQVVSPQVLSVAEVVSGLQPILQRLSAGVELVIEAPPCGHVLADPSQLEQVILNLVLNARDATPDGGLVQVTARAAERRGSDGAGGLEAGPGAWVAIEVSDAGHGMTEEVRARAFEPFFTTKPPGKGTGIGLATVRSIVDQAGGHIDLRTAPGRGSSFTVFLPRVAAAVAPRPSRVSGAVLLLDDDEIVRRTMARALSEAGFHVRDAGDLAGALRHCATERFDVVVTDLVVSHPQGPALFAALRDAAPGARVLVVSAVSPGPGLAPGAEVHHLAKPFPPETLVRRLRELLAS